MDQALVHEGSGRMEFPRAGRRSGWSDTENKLLWETADEAQQQGLPLKAVFEQIARQTGRRPNSIRNYYYAQVREHEGGGDRPARFVPFTQQEVDWLMEQVLVARSAGQSVRSCLQKLSGGDHSLMLRYQNKYRAVIKSRPDYVQDIVEKLKSQGVECETPQVNHRVRADLHQITHLQVTSIYNFPFIISFLSCKNIEQGSLSATVFGYQPDALSFGYSEAYFFKENQVAE